MSKEVNQILEWQSTQGFQRSLLIVTDPDLPEDDVNHQQLELSRYNSSDDAWETERLIDNIDELESFGIPESFIN